MAASAKLSQLPQSRNLLTPRSGVITLYGYGINAYVDRGHLVLKDGIGANRFEARLARVGHGLRRLVIIGSDGFVSLEALRWLADQDAAFVMLDRDGSVLTTTGPVRPSDSRLRRAQALAHTSGIAVLIAKELIAEKLAGQERVVRELLRNDSVGDLIATNRVSLAKCDSIDKIRQCEAQAAYAYWSAWRELPINYPSRDLKRIPGRWRTFGARQSPLTGSPRLAVNPPSAMLNYLYAVLESEARLAAAAVGLDPGIGILHVDTDARDSLACDLMEPVRPQVDAYLLDWLMKRPLRREWFFEQRDGSCRLMGSFAVQLSETAATWRHAVGPFAEMVCRMLWSKRKRPHDQFEPPTHLTQKRRREAKGRASDLQIMHPPKPPKVCKTCGKQMKYGAAHCAACSLAVSTQALVEAAKQGRIAGHTEQARLRQAKTQRRHHAARQAWDEAVKPARFDEQAYRTDILPRLIQVSTGAIAAAIGVSRQYSILVRRGERIPHPMHWQKLGQLVGVPAAKEADRLSQSP